MNGQIPPLRERAGSAVRGIAERLSPRQRQYALLGLILVAGVSLLWMILALTASPPNPGSTPKPQDHAGGVTNIGVLPPGAQVNPVDQWVGTAGRKLAQYESERDEQNRLNKERSAFEQRTMQRFAELEQKLTSASQAAASVPPSVQPPAAPAPTAPTTAMPPAEALPQRPAGHDSAQLGMPPGTPAMPIAPTLPETPRISRITITPRDNATSHSAQPAATEATTHADGTKATDARTISTFLPVSFTRGTLLGGLDAPTGGQSQSNPHPVLIRLSDTSVLPNRMRGEYRECFVIAAGYGDISSERAYLRTESLSCVRPDGATLEVRIQGSIYGEDGKVGLRGRLVTKQGQMLANALLAGVVSGIGQGLATSSTEYSTSALGTVATANGSDAYRAGLGSGVGKALDRLAQYYIKLAENTFPVIEVDAGREIDVVITKGVRIDTPMTAAATTSRSALSPANRYLETSDDPNY
ncbi:TraB pilus assembly [Thauera phenylacetica B4P]|uniref:TraB pilus assembly n=1 Tax=Thauera phenylacetica B4P TaxID=1234382 RepID=N6ZXH2_9RHOO|nr:TrbI/VirB10 family protein [Thauera phenylacetica]ENO99023.1 TraB pilus assembly [Thauera phenylacetica B4P]